MLRSSVVFTAWATTLVIPNVFAQTVGTFPHIYPGQPTGDLGPEWQDCTWPSSKNTLTHCPIFITLITTDFEVKDPLPNVTFPLERSFAGNIPIGRPGQPNDTLFFWAFEKKNGSLTGNTSSEEPWGIWLQGGYVSGEF